MAHQGKAVACKTIRGEGPGSDFLHDVKNLQLLKESLTQHDRIMLHMATIIHGSNYHILLPIAEYGDLELFLNEGYEWPESEISQYDFESRFPLVYEELPNATLRQLKDLADAMRWLHDDLYISDNEDLYCAHMELKPNSILIVPNDNSSPQQSQVGKWMFSDFGLSVLTRSTEGRPTSPAATVSIRDMHHAFAEGSIRTRPRGSYGAYQAPEVQPNESATVGRQSDVWSFGCIIAEVVVFAVGMRELVQEFRKIRKGNIGTDCFYSVARPSTGGSSRSAARRPSRGSQRYELRPWITKWLLGLPGELNEDLGDWFRCIIQYLMKVLDPVPTTRPSSSELCNQLDHVERCHFHGHSNGPHPDGISCPAVAELSSPTTPQLPIQGFGVTDAASSRTVSCVELPAGSRSPTMTSESGETPSGSTIDNLTDEIESLLAVSPICTVRPSLPSPPPSVTAVSPISSVDPRGDYATIQQDSRKTNSIATAEFSTSTTVITTSSAGRSVSPTDVSVSSEGSRQTYQGGYTSRSSGLTAPLSATLSSSSSTPLSSATQIARSPPSRLSTSPTPTVNGVQVHKVGGRICVAVSRHENLSTPRGYYMAWLHRDCIEVYSIPIDPHVPSIDGATYKHATLDIPSDRGWKETVISGSFVVAWGHSSSGKGKLVSTVEDLQLSDLLTVGEIYVCDLENRLQDITHPSRESLSTLQGIALSQQGCVTFVCDNTLLFTRIE